MMMKKPFVKAVPVKLDTTKMLMEKKLVSLYRFYIKETLINGVLILQWLEMYIHIYLLIVLYLCKFINVL